MHYGLGVLWDAMASLQDIPRSKMHMALFCMFVCLFCYACMPYLAGVLVHGAADSGICRAQWLSGRVWTPD